MTTPPRYGFGELERYLAGELDAERTKAIEAEAERDAELGRWLAERRADQRAFLLDPRRRAFTSLVEEAGAKPARRTAWLPILGLVSAAAASLLAVVFTGGPTTTMRTKGALAVRTAVLGAGEPRLLEGDRTLHPGDRLRLTVEDPAGGYLTVLLQEANGDVDVIYTPDELGRLAPGAHVLPGSLELDHAIGRERLWVIVADDAPDPAAWEAELEAAHGKAGFDNGWLPAGNARVATVDYTKAAP